MAVSPAPSSPSPVSLVKRALTNLAADMRLNATQPNTREEWAALMQRVGVKGIHIAERDTQWADIPKRPDEFVNTWSVEGFVSEGLQPAELGWGSHERHVPPEATFHAISAQPADLKQWVTDLIGRAVDERASLVLDLGGGEAILRDYNEDTSLVEFCDEVGMESVGLFMCGADPADFDHVVGIWDSGHFRPRQSILVFNEFLAPPGRSALGAFDFVMKRPEYDRLMEEGVRCLTIPRLVPMPAMRNAGLSFHDAIEGKPGRSGKPLGPMERHQLRKWVERLEEGLSAIQAEDWLP